MKPREALAAGEGTLRNAMHIPATTRQAVPVLLVWDHPHAPRVWRFGKLTGWPDGDKPTYAMDGGRGAHQHLRHHALGGGTGHRSLTRSEDSIIPFKAADLSQGVLKGAGAGLR